MPDYLARLEYEELPVAFTGDTSLFAKLSRDTSLYAAVALAAHAAKRTGSETGVPDSSPSVARTGKRMLIDSGRDSVALSVGDIEVVLIGNRFAHALAVEAPPSPHAARVAVQAVKFLREHRVIDQFTTLGVAFQGARKPAPDTIDALRSASVYAAVKDLRESALDNAKGFLAEVDSTMPEAVAIADVRPRKH